MKVFDEYEYVCKPGDTYESLSKQYYEGSPNYAKALQRHNQNHARASDQMARTGQLAPGERVYIPQAYVLEERYADAIPKPAPAASSTMTPATFVPPSSGSPPLIPVPTPPPAPPAPLPGTPAPNR